MARTKNTVAAVETVEAEPVASELVVETPVYTVATDAAVWDRNGTRCDKGNVCDVDADVAAPLIESGILRNG